jgi:pyruvate carboxylase subunit B
VVKLASEQLNKPIFKEDPLELMEPGIPKAKKLLKENDLPVNDENIFIVASCENKGLDYLLGKSKQSIRKIEKEEPEESISVSASRSQDPVTGQNTYAINVNNSSYQVVVGRGAIPSPVGATIPPVNAPTQTFQAPPVAVVQPAPAAPNSPTAGSVTGEPVKAQIPGKILRLEVKEGDMVNALQTLLVMEAMKMETEIKAPREGKVEKIHVVADDAVQTADILVTIA